MQHIFVDKANWVNYMIEAKMMCCWNKLSTYNSIQQLHSCWCHKVEVVGDEIILWLFIVPLKKSIKKFNVLFIE
jgi:hypothetical protein